MSGLERIRITVHAFWIDIDQTHHHRGEWVDEITVARVAAIGIIGWGKPCFFGTPIDVLFWMPNIRPAEGEAESLQTHRLVGHGTGIGNQIGPAELVAVFFLNWPEQTTRLIQIDVIRPRIKRRKALVAGTGSAPTVSAAVGPGRMPRHTNHQATVMAPI